MKKLISSLILLAVLSLSAFALSFTDVSPDSWYYEDVDNAVRLGIINGKSTEIFAPDDNLTYAEAIKLAACMHQLYAEGTIWLTSLGDPWYSSYLEYCLDNAIITTEFFEKTSKPDEYATRAGYMEIFANALPDEALAAINNVPDDSIPDVTSSAEYAPAVYKLYRAGILQGVDELHNCKPHDNIKRCEVAAIITRMMNENKRVKFSMGEEITEEPTVEKPKEEEPKQEPEEENDEPIEDNSEVVETPDMYPDLAISGQPVYKQSADEGEIIRYWTVASGGKEPYTYKWYIRDARYGDVAVENGEYIDGADTDTLEFTYGIDNPYLGSRFYCEITDALGSKVKCDSVKAPEAIFVGIVDPDNVVEYQGNRIFVTRVQSGSIKKGQAVLLYSEDLQIFGLGYVDKIEMFKKELDEATAGNNVGLLIKDFVGLSSFDYLTEFCSEETLEKLYQQKNFVVKAPLFVFQEEEAYANANDELEMSAYTLGGRPPYTYKWQISLIDENYFDTISESNGMNLSGIDTPTLVIPAVNYLHYCLEWRCLVTDADGAVAYAENSTRVMPIEDIRFYKIPYSVYAEYGETVRFTAEALATDGITVEGYQWGIKTDNHNKFVEIEAVDTWARGYDTPNLELDVDMSMFASHARVRCVATDSRGKKLVSQEAQVLPKSVYITKQPGDITLYDGVYGAEFDLKAEGGKEPYTYTWQMACAETDGEFVNVEGIDNDGVSAMDKSSILTVVSDKFIYTGDIRFRCIVQDATGRKVTSKEARLIFETPATVSLEKRGKPEDETIVIMG